MDSDTIAFGVPVAGLFLGAAILVASLFLTGLSPVTIIGGSVAMLGIVGLAFAVARSATEEPSVDVVRREGREPRRARGAK
jgi:hypothetical protein